MDKRCRHFQFQVIDCSYTSWNTLVFGHCRIIYLYIIILRFSEEGEFNLSSDIKNILSMHQQTPSYILKIGIWLTVLIFLGNKTVLIVEYSRACMLGV